MFAPKGHKKKTKTYILALLVGLVYANIYIEMYFMNSFLDCSSLSNFPL